MLCLMYIKIKEQLAILLLLIPHPYSHTPILLVKEITQ